MKKLSRNLARNAVFLFLDWLSISLLNFIFWSLSSKLLSPEEYGIISTSINFSTLLSNVALFGLNATLWKLIPEYLKRKKFGKVKSLVGFSVKSVLAMSISLILLLFVVQEYVRCLLGMDMLTFTLTLLNIVIISFWSLFGSVLLGFQRVKKMMYTDLVGHVAKIIFTALFVILGYSYLGPVLGYAFGIFSIVLMRFPRGLVAWKDGVDKKKIITNFAIPALISNFAWVVFINGQYVLITGLKTPEITGFYTIALLMTVPIVSIPNILSTSLFPIISSLTVAKNTLVEKRKLIEETIRLSLTFSIPVAIVLFFVSRNAVLIFSDERYLEALTFLPYLILAALIYGLGIVLSQSLYSLGKPKTQRNIVLGTMAMFLLTGVPLTYLFSGIGTSLAYLISVTFLAVYSYVRVKEMVKLKILIKDLAKIAFASLLTITMLYFFTIFGLMDKLLPSIILGVVSGVVFILLLSLLRFFNKIDMFFFEYVIGLIPVIRKKKIRSRMLLLLNEKYKNGKKKGK